MKLETRIVQLDKQRSQLELDRAAKQGHRDRLVERKETAKEGSVMPLPERRQLATDIEGMETTLQEIAKLLAEVEVERASVEGRIQRERQETFNQEERPRRSREIEEAARQIMGNLWQAAVDNHDEAMARVVNPDQELQRDIQRITGTPQPRSSRAVHLTRETTRFIRETVERSMKELP